MRFLIFFPSGKRISRYSSAALASGLCFKYTYIISVSFFIKSLCVAEYSAISNNSGSKALIAFNTLSVVTVYIVSYISSIVVLILEASTKALFLVSSVRASSREMFCCLAYASAFSLVTFVKVCTTFSTASLFKTPLLSKS